MHRKTKKLNESIKIDQQPEAQIIKTIVILGTLIVNAIQIAENLDESKITNIE